VPAPRTARRLAAVLPVAVAAAFAAPSAALACDGTTALPGAADRVALEATTICLVNEERANAGLEPLAAQRQLAAAAAAHGADMVARGYFAHVAPDGGTLLDRIVAAGWVPRAGDWTAGEDLAWGSGALASPERIVAAWMASPGHRANILRPEFDQIGMAVVTGAPGVDAATAGTYVADFGTREDDGAAAPRPRAKRRAKAKAKAKAKARAKKLRRARARARRR
jgi:uncharacterized protein YkwD